VEDQVSKEAFEDALKAAIGKSAMHQFTSPMNDAELSANNANPATAAAPGFITFKSDDSSVYSITGGKVKMIARIDHMKVVIVEKDGRFYAYSNLGSTLLKTGDQIQPNQLIGYAAFDLDGFKPSLDLYVSDAEKNISLVKADFAERTKRQIDHSVDFSEPR
jgi:hypothetical protein